MAEKSHESKTTSQPRPSPDEEQFLEKLHTLPVEQERRVQSEFLDLSAPYSTLGIGSGEFNSKLCAFCRKYNMQECIQKFCPQPSHMMESAFSSVQEKTVTSHAESVSKDIK